MYTLLTALGMAAGYALLRVLAASHGPAGYPKARLRWWIGFSACRHRRCSTPTTSPSSC
jgi:hypothetical protein